jgi:hypothetical protein
MRWLIGCVAAVALLSVLQLAPGSRPPPQHLAELVPWRPTLAMRFSGQMAAMNEPLNSASDWNGYVTMTLASASATRPGCMRSPVAPPGGWRSTAAAACAATRCAPASPDGG